jgi:hypothetical protein
MATPLNSETGRLTMAKAFVDRRNPRAQRPILGGARQSDPPLTTRHCADWMGLTPAWVIAAIDEGVTVRGRVVKLEAEILPLSRRRVIRIHVDRFIVFLTAIGFKRVPTVPRPLAVRAS